MSLLSETMVGKWLLKLFILILPISFILIFGDYGIIKYFLLILFLIFLFSLITFWTSLFFDLTSFKERFLFFWAVTQYSFLGQPIPLVIDNGVISNDYFLTTKTSKRIVLLIRNQSAAIIQDDQGMNHFLREGIFFLPKKCKILYSLDVGIQKLDFGPLLYEDPFSLTNRQESFIFQQTRNERLQSANYQTKDQNLIYLSGTLIYQINFEPDLESTGYFPVPEMLNHMVFTNGQEIPSDGITDDVNKSVLSLVTRLLQSVIMQFTLYELVTTNRGILEKVIADLNLYFSGCLLLNERTYSYLTESQINNINENMGCMQFNIFRLSLTKVWIAPDQRRDLLKLDIP